MRLAWGQSCPEGMITSWAKQCDRKVQGDRTGEEMMERLQCLVASHSLCHLRGHMPRNSLQIHRFVLDHVPLSSQIRSSRAKRGIHSHIVSHR